MPKISVIVPIYKVETYLKRCIDSILNQTFTDIECILVDDGSPDKCGEICDEYLSKDKRVRVIHKQNGGLSDARNAGIEIATGEYISFIDGDDFIHPNTYELVVKVAENKSSDIVCFHYQFIEPNTVCNFEKLDINEILDNSVTIHSTEFLENFDQYYHSVSWISACTKIYKRKIFKNHRYPYGKVDEDSYMLHHLISEANNITRINTPLYYYVWTDGSISRSAFSAKRFHKNGSNLDRVMFFKERNIKSQVYYFERLYLIEVLKMYYTVKNNHPEFMNTYKPYLKEYKKNLKSFLQGNNKICRMENLIFRIFAISPKLAERLYNKYLA